MKRELLDKGNIWRKTDGRWIGMVRYRDEFGEMKRKSFSSKKKKDLQEKMTDFVINFQEQLINSDETRKPLRESMKKWLQVYKYPEIEHTTYDRYECTAENQIYPYIGDKPVEDITSADIKKLMTLHLNKGYAFTTTKKTYSILKMYFDHLFREGQINYNPMAMITMIKKANYDAAQNKETKAKCDEVTVFTDEELELIRAEAFRKFGNGKPVRRSLPKVRQRQACISAIRSILSDAQHRTESGRVVRNHKQRHRFRKPSGSHTARSKGNPCPRRT